MATATNVVKIEVLSDDEWIDITDCIKSSYTLNSSIEFVFTRPLVLPIEKDDE
jgi:hypothetical protein